MRIHRLTLESFRGVSERTVVFADTGLTIVQGENEAGKTSLVEALDLLLDYRDDSTAAAVRNVKPIDADVGAYVEAELSAGPYRFTYAKRFHKERSTTLTVHEPSAEHLTGRPAHDRVNAILDEYVDRPLWAALRLQQGVALDQANLADGASLASALDAVAGAGLGGDRESTVFERVRAEYERYHTPTGRPTKLVTAAVQAHTDARDEADQLSDELDELDRDVERASALARAVEDRSAELVLARRRADELGVVASDLEQRAGDVEQLRLAAQVAAAERDRAEQAVATRAQLAEAAGTAATQAEELRRAADAAAPDLADAEKRSAAAGEQVAALRAEVDSARAAAADRTAERDRVRLVDQLRDLERTQARVADAQSDLREADATLQACRVDAAALAGIEAAERELATARAALDVDATSVVVRALSDVSLHGPGGTRDLAADEQVVQPAGEALVLRIGDVAEVTVTPGSHVQQRAEAAARAEDLLADRLAEVGLADPDEARADHARRRDAEQSAATARASLAAQLGDLTPELLSDRIFRLKVALGGDVARDGDVADLDAAEDAVREARRALDEAQSALEDAQAAQRDAADALAGLRARAGVLEDRATAAEERCAAAAHQLEQAREEHPDEELSSLLAAATSAAEEAQVAYGAAAAALEAQDPESVRADAEHAASVVRRLTDDLRREEDELRDVRARLLVRGEQGLHDAFDAARSALEHAERERTRIEAQAAAARLLYERMAAHRDAARRAYAAPFREKLERLGAIVFGDGLRVELDEDLRIARRTLGGLTLDYEQLSSGAREQLSVLARLACAAIVGSDGGVPLILDDALGYSDPGRLERLGAAFRIGARETQVIVFTCVPERYQHVGEATVVHL